MKRFFRKFVLVLFSLSVCFILGLLLYTGIKELLDADNWILALLCAWVSLGLIVTYFYSIFKRTRLDIED